MCCCGPLKYLCTLLGDIIFSVFLFLIGGYVLKYIYLVWIKGENFDGMTLFSSGFFVPDQTYIICGMILVGSYILLRIISMLIVNCDCENRRRPIYRNIERREDIEMGAMSVEYNKIS